MISIVVPILNEAENIPHLLRAIGQNLAEDFEVVFVDDQSVDDSARIARRCCPDLPVRVVERTGTRDLGLSVLAGIAVARGQYVVVMDADLSHDPVAIPGLISRLRSGACFVVGSRFHPSASMAMSRHRKVIAWVGKRLSASLSTSSDPFSGFFAFRRVDLPMIPLRPIGFKIGLEIQVRGYFEAEDVPIAFQPRLWGFSKVNLGQIYKAVKHLIGLHRLKHRSSAAAFASSLGEDPDFHGGTP